MEKNKQNPSSYITLFKVKLVNKLSEHQLMPLYIKQQRKKAVYESPKSSAQVWFHSFSEQLKTFDPHLYLLLIHNVSASSLSENRVKTADQSNTSTVLHYLTLRQHLIDPVMCTSMSTSNPYSGRLTGYLVLSVYVTAWEVVRYSGCKGQCI